MNDVQPIFVALKRQLKARRVSYAELARRLGMSEANVKRIFSERSCSLSRLAQICDAIELTLAELIGAAGDLTPDFYELPAHATAFFADHLDYFVFYRQLEHGHGVAELQRRNDLSDKEVNRYLRKLEELRLIERMPGDRIKHLYKGYLQLPAGSRLQREYFQRWVPQFFERVMSPGEKHFLKIFSTGLSEKNRQELVRDLEDLVQKYQERGYFDQAKGASPFESVGVCIGLGPYRVGEGKVADYRR